MNIKKFTQKDRYGNSVSVEFEVPPMDSIPNPDGGHPGQPMGTDTVPAWLTPGEFVMNAEAVRKFKPQLEAMNNHGRVEQKAQGGSIPTYKNMGGMVQQPEGNMMPGMVGGLTVMDPMQGATGPTWNNSMDAMPPQMGVQYRAPGGYIDPRASQIDDETAMFLKQMEELRQMQNKPSIMQGFIPGNEQIPQGQMVGSQGVQPIPEKPAMQLPTYPEPVQAVPGQESVMPVNEVGSTDFYGNPVTEADILREAQFLRANFPHGDNVTVLSNNMGISRERAQAALQSGEYSGRGSVGMPEANRGRGQGYEMRDKIIETTLGHEGGKANDPVDKGGKTNFGITQTTYNNMGFKGDVNDLTREEAKEFYNKYWDSFNIDSYPPHLQDQIFDMYTNHSPRGVAKILQRAAGVEDDGIVGPQTMAAIQNLDPNKLVESRKDYYEMIMENDPSQEKFRNGWMNRAESFRKGGDDNPQVPRGDESDVPQIFNSAMANADSPEGNYYQQPGVDSQSMVDAVGDVPEMGVDSRPPMHGPVGGVERVDGRGPIVAGVDALNDMMTPSEPLSGVGAVTKENEEIDNKIKGLEQQLFDQKLVDPNSQTVKDIEARIEDLKSKRSGNEQGIEDRMVFDREQDRREAEKELEELEAAKKELEAAGIDTTDVDQEIAGKKNELGTRGGRGDKGMATYNKDREEYLKSIVDETEKGLTEEELDAAIQMDEDLRSGKIENAATQAPEGSMEKVMSFLEEWGITDLFDKKEIGRMAALYLGSRVLGYSHAGSINWAAKQYLTRVDAKVAAHDKLVGELTKEGKYSKASIAAFKKSKDINDLVAAGLSFTPTGDRETFMVGGKKVMMEKVKGSDGGYYFRTQAGQVFSPGDYRLRDYDKSLDPSTDEYRQRTERARGKANELFEEIYQREGKFDTGDGIVEYTNFGPKTAAAEFVAWAESEGLNPESPSAMAIMRYAYQEAIADGKGAEGRNQVKPDSLRPYLEGMYLREKTGAQDLLMTNSEAVDKQKEYPKYVRGDKMTMLRANARKLASQQLPDVSPEVGTKQVFDHAVKKWGELGEAEQKRYIDMAKKAGDESGFYVFMSEQVQNFILNK